MLYTVKEEHEHDEMKKQFWFRYKTLLDTMQMVCTERGTRLRTLAGGSAPLHHRMTPEGMVHEMRKKARRIEETMTHDFWYRDPELLCKVVEECVDAANYALFLASLSQLLWDEIVFTVEEDENETSTD